MRIKFVVPCVVLSFVLVACVKESTRPATSVMRQPLTYERNCATCHGDGENYPGTSALRAKYRGTLPAVLDQRTDLDEATIKYFVRNGYSVMPPFRKTEVSDADLDEIVSYLMRNRGPTR